MTAPLLRCENLHKSYVLGRTTLDVLRGVDMNIPAGRFVSIMGSSGSGKSTLLHILGGLDVPQRGQVFFRGQPVFEPEGQRCIPLGRDADPAEAKARPGQDRESRAAGRGVRFLEERRNDLRNTAFGFVFQFYHLLPEFDIVENVLLPAMVGQSAVGWSQGNVAARARALALLGRVGLEGRLNHRPSELSGGERQRVAIARALIREPAVLLADEPTGNLDGKTGRGIIQLLRELNVSGQTVVMVTHDRQLAEGADEVVKLEDGRLK